MSAVADPIVHLHGPYERNGAGTVRCGTCLEIIGKTCPDCQGVAAKTHPRGNHHPPIACETCHGWGFVRAEP